MPRARASRRDKLRTHRVAGRMISAVAKTRRGADVLLEILESEGVQYIFGNPGTTELPFMDALLGAPELQYVLALQEASAVAMADGYAQAARRPAFVNLHTSGGLTFVVMNNGGYNILKNSLRTGIHYVSANSDRFIGMDIERPSIDYVHAQSMGVPAARVERAADIAPTIEAGIASGNANLVEVIITAS